jgi:hypothetical protein
VCSTCHLGSGYEPSIVKLNGMAIPGHSAPLFFASSTSMLGQLICKPDPRTLSKQELMLRLGALLSELRYLQPVFLWLSRISSKSTAATAAPLTNLRVNSFFFSDFILLDKIDAQDKNKLQRLDKIRETQFGTTESNKTQHEQHTLYDSYPEPNPLKHNKRTQDDSGWLIVTRIMTHSDSNNDS